MSLGQQIEKFLAFGGSTTGSYQIETVAPYVLKFTPLTIRKQMTLGFLALVHGNETIGLPILNQLLQFLTTGEVQVDFEIYFALGNVEAAQKNVRFLEEDLNRCFGTDKTASLESARARELEVSLLNHCDYVIDLHQTQRASRKPFFIFQYSSPRCLSILKKFNLGVPTVLQTDPIGENTGLSTDEYLRLRGGFGTALELGEKGDFQHFDLGLDICKRSLLTLSPLPMMNSVSSGNIEFPLYQLQGRFKALDSSYQLDPSLKNFEELRKGMSIGNSERGPILAPESGFMLFPRFQNVLPGCELFHYCTPVHHQQLKRPEKEILFLHSSTESTKTVSHYGQRS